MARNGKNNPKNLQLIQTDKWQQQRILMLLANLAYVEVSAEEQAQGVPQYARNRLPEMGEFAITPEVLDMSGMTAEANYLRAMEADT